MRMPMAAFKGYEPGSSRSRDGLTAGRAPLGEELAEAIGTVGLVLSGCELLPCQHRLAVGTHEAFPMPGLERK